MLTTVLSVQNSGLLDVLAHARLGGAYLGRDYRISSANTVLQEWLQLTEAELNQLTLFDIVVKEDRPFLKTEEGAVFYAVVRLPQRQQEPLSVHLSYLPVADGSGYLVVFEDVDKQVQLATALQDERERNHILFQLPHNNLHVLDQYGNLLQASDAFCQLLGYTQAEMQGMSVQEWDMSLPQNVDMAEHIALLPERGETRTITLRRKDGSTFPAQIHIVLEQLKGQCRIYVTVKDISDSVREKEARSLFELIYKNSSTAILITDERNNIIDANPAFTEISGYKLHEVVGKNPRVFSSGRHPVEFYKQMWGTLLAEGVWQGEIWDRRKNGETYPKWMRLSVLRNHDGSVSRYVAQFFDLTEEKNTQSLLWQQANYDALTNLPNRRLLHDRINQIIKQAQRDTHAFSLLFIDLDRFQDINDTLGHDVGDRLLIEASKRIVNCVRASDTVARLGGDEFAIVLAEVRDTAFVERIMRNILSEFSKPFLLDGKLHHITASIGVTSFPQDAKTVDELMRYADQALYAAKENGRNCYHYYTEKIQQQAEQRVYLINDLRLALERNELEVYFQPIIDFKTGEIKKAEALLRWHHPTRGMVSPAIFIPLAEEVGLISKLGEWVFERSIELLHYIKQEMNQTIQISINKSPTQFSETMAPQRWVEVIDRHNLAHDCIAVEITEGLLLKDSVEAKEYLNALHALEIPLSLDDFGTGYSSLSYLKKMNASYLKIDRSFICNITQDHNDMVLTEAIIVMARKLGIRTIAEGIETEGQRDLLMQFGCDYGQGYLFSRPIPANEFIDLLKRDPALHFSSSPPSFSI